MSHLKMEAKYNFSSRSLALFDDIIRDRRGTSNFMWMSREWHPVLAYYHECKTDPHKLKKAVIKSPRLQQVIEELSAEQNIPKELLYKEVWSILDEVGHKRDLAIIRLLGLLLITLLKRHCSGLLVNELQLKKIRTEMGHTPVLLAPSHRSYVDFMLISYICFHYDIQIPATVATVDFHSMWLFGELMREACAFFIRRSFGSNRLYSTTFREYVSKLVTDGESAVQFYIEGTRSRSGKSRMPKCGFLSMALTPFFTGYVPDITILPWSICFDRTPEELLFAYELLGVPKPKESTSGLMKAMRMSNEQYGRIYVELGDPISVRRWCEGRIDRLQHALEPPSLARPNSQESALCMDLAHHIVQTQQDLMIINCFNLVALVLNDNILQGADTLTVPEVAKEINWLKSVLETLGALVALPDDLSGVEAAVREALGIHKSLVCLTPSGTIQLGRVHHPGKEIDPTKLKGHYLSEDTMHIATPLLMLQNYVNPCLHFCINPAIVTVLMQHLDQSRQISKGELFSKYCFVRSVFSHEFVLYSARATKEFEEALMQLDLLNIVEVVKDGKLALGNHKKLQLILCNLLRPFLEGYLVVIQTLQEFATAGPVPEQQLIPAIQKAVEDQLASHQLSHAASLSLEMHAAALDAFTAMQALAKPNINGLCHYQVVGECLQEVAYVLNNLVTHPQEKQLPDPFDVRSWLVHEARAKL